MAASATVDASGTGLLTGRRHLRPVSQIDERLSLLRPGSRRSEIHAFVCNRLAFHHVEPAAVDRALAAGRTGVLHDENLAARLGAEFALEVRVRMKQHRSRTEQSPVDRKLTL